METNTPCAQPGTDTGPGPSSVKQEAIVETNTQFAQPGTNAGPGPSSVKQEAIVEEAIHGDNGLVGIEVAESSPEAYSRKDEGPVQTEAESSMSLRGYAPKEGAPFAQPGTDIGPGPAPSSRRPWWRRQVLL